jgi:hypothetical protein
VGCSNGIYFFSNRQGLGYEGGCGYDDESWWSLGFGKRSV